MEANGIESKEMSIKNDPCCVSREKLSLTSKATETTRKFAPIRDIPKDGGYVEAKRYDSKAQPPYGHRWTGPDCSWSWVIAVACSLLNFFTLAVLRSGSVVYLNTIEFYDVSRADASWPPSLVNAVSNLSGLVTGYLTRRFGPRRVALVGSTLSCVAISACYFADNVSKLTILCGAFHGFGMGLNVPAVAVCLNLWFDKKKVMASGIIYTGAALGSLFFPSFLDYVISTFGFRGGITLLGAVMGHAIACALLIRLPPWVNIDGSRKVRSGPAPRRCPTVERFDPDHPLIKSGKYMIRSISQHSIGSDVSDEDHTHTHTNKFHEAVHHHTVEPVKEEVDEDVEERGVKKDVLYTAGCETQLHNETAAAQQSTVGPWRLGSSDHLPEGLAGLGRVTSSKGAPCTFTGTQVIAGRTRGESVRSVSVFTGITGINTGALPFSRRESVSSGHRLRLRRSSSAISTTISLYAPAISIECAAEQDFEIDECYTSAHIHSDQVRATPVVDLSPSILIYLVGLTYVALINCNTCFQTIMLDHAQSQGVDAHKAVYLLWGFALCDIAGRLSVGLISDTGLMSRPVIMGCASMIFGACLSIAPFTTGFPAMMLLCMVIGFSLGTSVVLITVLVGDYTGDLSRIAMYIGWMGFASGVTGIGRPLVIGFFRDAAGHYGGLLRLMGACMFSCGLAWHGVNVGDKMQKLRHSSKQ